MITIFLRQQNFPWKTIEQDLHYPGGYAIMLHSKKDGGMALENYVKLREVFLAWLLAANLVSVIMTCLDKRLAVKKGSMRIPEKTLFAAAFLGGAPGMYAAMRLIRHKTLHKRFMIGLPAIMALHICAAGAVYHFYFI